LPPFETLPQFLASGCISGISKEHFLDSIFVSRKMVTANSSKPDTCQKLRQGAGNGKVPDRMARETRHLPECF
jgi:hypothetical protein